MRRCALCSCRTTAGLFVRRPRPRSSPPRPPPEASSADSPPSLSLRRPLLVRRTFDPMRNMVVSHLCLDSPTLQPRPRQAVLSTAALDHPSRTASRKLDLAPRQLVAHSDSRKRFPSRLAVAFPSSLFLSPSSFSPAGLARRPLSAPDALEGAFCCCCTAAGLLVRPASPPSSPATFARWARLTRSPSVLFRRPRPPLSSLKNRRLRASPNRPCASTRRASSPPPPLGFLFLRRPPRTSSPPGAATRRRRFCDRVRSAQPLPHRRTPSASSPFVFLLRLPFSGELG